MFGVNIFLNLKIINLNVNLIGLSGDIIGKGPMLLLLIMQLKKGLLISNNYLLQLIDSLNVNIDVLSELGDNFLNVLNKSIINGINLLAEIKDLVYKSL